MHVDERVVRTVGQMLGLDITRPGGATTAWFVARQPGVVRFLEYRLQGDALAVALHGAQIIERSFETHDGTPPPRLIRPLLERAESTVVGEARSQTPVHDGCAARQPALITWLSGFVADHPLLLDERRRHRVTSCLAAVIYGFDQLTTGRPIP